MKYKTNFLSWLIILLYYIYKIKCYNIDDEDEDDKYFHFEAIDDHGKVLKTFKVDYNYNTHLFNNYIVEELDNLIRKHTPVKSILVCKYHSDYKKIEKAKNDTIVLWNTSGVEDTLHSLVYTSVFPHWYNEQKRSFCLRVESVGWDDNANKEICEGNQPCPDMIILGTTQFTTRYNKGDTMVLDEFYRNYFKKHGYSLESKLNKYFLYDYRIDNNWLAVPLIVDFRVFKYNTVVFEKCKEKYDLHYPPPHDPYWGENYQNTWTWEVAFEYMKKLHDCTGDYGFSIVGSKSEDTKLFFFICQSLGIPVIVEDYENSVKKCGLNLDSSMEKLKIIKKIFENKYIEPWLDETSIRDWLNLSYLNYTENQSMIPYKIYSDFSYNTKKTVGMMIDVDKEEINGDKYKLAYMPGSSSFLGGSGIVITKKKGMNGSEKYFNYIENLIKEEYGYLKKFLNNGDITPYSDGCENSSSTQGNDKKSQCNSILSEHETIPYYYEFNNQTKIVYLTHTDKGFSLNPKSYTFGNKNEIDSIFTESIYKCDKEANFEKSTVTYYGPDVLEFPLSSNKSLYLKSMADYKKTKKNNNFGDNKCRVNIDTLSKARPMQFPFSSFSELNDIEIRGPISRLLARLYYKDEVTYEGTFEDMVNECCEVIDKCLKPSCVNYTRIKFRIDECDSSTRKMKVTYLNCDSTGLEDLDETVNCSYIPMTHSTGLIIIMSATITILVELAFVIIVIKYKKERCILLAGFKFLLSLFFSTIILDISVIFWIGKASKYQCIFKIWTMIVGITGFICSYSYKSHTIISIYNNRRITNSHKKIKTHIVYMGLFILQIILLFIWSFSMKNGIKQVSRNLKNAGIYQITVCSTGNESLLTSIFVLDYCLLILSIIMAYQGRNIPDDYNYYKKIFITSLVSCLLLVLCHIIIQSNIGDIYIYVTISLFVLFISLMVNITFIGSRILILLNIGTDNHCSVIVVSNDNPGADYASSNFSYLN